MAKARWVDVKKGDRVELAGKTWDVLKAKAKGQLVKVTVEREGKSFTRELPATDKVKLAKATPLRDSSNAQARWATKGEVEKTLGKLESGDPKVKTPPAKPGSAVWDLPRDRIEAKLDSLLEARLVAESPNVGMGYYVPPVDASTVAAHLLAFHAIEPKTFVNESAMLDVHHEAHRKALDGELYLYVNHWHTKTRPDLGTKA